MAFKPSNIQNKAGYLARDVQAMYEAKELGKNRYVLHEDTTV